MRFILNTIVVAKMEKIQCLHRYLDASIIYCPKEGYGFDDVSFSFSITNIFILPLILLPEREVVASTLRVNLFEFDLFSEIMYKYFEVINARK